MLGLITKMMGGREEEEEVEEEVSDCDVMSASSTDEESLGTPPVPKINIESITTIESCFSEPPLEDSLTNLELSQLQGSENDCNSQSSSTCDSADFSLPSHSRRRIGKPTNKDILRRVSELVEYYLSDQNLINDMFLLKHVTKHKEGYVSLKLLSNYKKLKRLRKDWTVLVEALKDSPLLEMNSDCTKVRRRQELPCQLEEDTRLFRTVLSYEISETFATIEKLAEIFTKFGEIDSIQLQKPGGRSLPEIILAEKEQAGISASFCCLVVYEKVHCARLALKHLANHSDMKVMAIPKRKASPVTKLDTSYIPREYESAYFSASDLEDPGSPFLFRSRSSHFGAHPLLVNNWRSRYNSSSSCTNSPRSARSNRRGNTSVCSSYDDRCSSRLSTSDGYVRARYPHHPPRPLSSLIRKDGVLESLHTPPDSPIPFRKFLPHVQASSAPNSPWARRKMLVRNDTNTSSENGWVVSPKDTSNIPPNVIRLPKGPDNTRGFHT